MEKHTTRRTMSNLFSAGDVSSALFPVCEEVAGQEEVAFPRKATRLPGIVPPCPVLTEVDASADPQQGGGHVVQRKRDVDDVIGRGSAQVEEGHAHDGFHVADPGRLGETWRGRKTRGGLQRTDISSRNPSNFC